MRECAICRAPGVQYLVEHVIPEALGGYYVLRDLVCVDCNSRLGDRVDSALVNHWLTKLYRFVHGLRGKAKTVPNPFAGHFTMQADSCKRMQVRLNRDGRFVPYVLPQVTHTDLDDKRVEVNVSVDAADEAKLDTIVSKIAKRMGVSADQLLANAQRVRVSDDSGLKGRRTIDLRDFKLGLLKIAYEFAVDRVPGYFESDDAKHASELLKEARLAGVERYVNIGDGFDHGILAPFSDFLAFGDQKHYLVLFGTDSSLLCFVHLHNLFTVGVTLSERSFGEFVQFGVNDIASRAFKVWTLEDLPVSTRYRPQLHFETAQAAVAFQQAEAAADFDYESEAGSWQLFQRDGTHLSLCIDDLVEHLAPSNQACITASSLTSIGSRRASTSDSEDPPSKSSFARSAPNTPGTNYDHSLERLLHDHCGIVQRVFADPPTFQSGRSTPCLLASSPSPAITRISLGAPNPDATSRNAPALPS